jgi:hypothetical protein
MDPIKTGHERPVNKQAAMLLAKAPWWAHYPEKAKAAVERLADRHEWSVVCDSTKAPPSGIEDKRGVQILSKDYSARTVIGYSHSRLKGSAKKPKPKNKPSWWIGEGWNPNYPHWAPAEKIHYWWVVGADDLPHTIRWRQPCARGWKVKKD